MNRRKLLQTLVGLVPHVLLIASMPLGGWCALENEPLYVEIPPPDFCPLPVKEANG